MEAVDVVVIGEHLRHVGMAHLVDHERGVDVLEHRVGHAPLLLLDEQGSGEALDLRHVREVLDHRGLVVLGHGAGRLRPIEVPYRPLAFVAHSEHALEIHARVSPVIVADAGV